MAIKLEVGKKYELNNGEVHECTKMHGDDPLAVDCSGYGPFVINGCLYHQDGTFADRASIQEYCGVKRCVDDPQLWRDMTPEEKRALLLAHYEEKVIEWSYGLPFVVGCNSEKSKPLWDANCAYRVKPEPVRETVTLRNFHEKAKGFIITFDVIDGKPDCASVKMEEL